MCGVTCVHPCPAISTDIHYSTGRGGDHEAIVTDDSVSPLFATLFRDQQMYPSSILTSGLSPELVDALFDQRRLVKINENFFSK